ncbi:MAG: trypsin-like serine protease [Parvularculaceae bacterium]|nr:trypsin-like serine protease [Parvularculaceae bacterium]
MKRLIVGLSAASAALVGAAQAGPIIDYTVERRIVTKDANNGVIPGTVSIFGDEITSINGTVYGDGPNYAPNEFSGVGQLVLTQTGQQGAGLCTGSRIGETQILTAAHCLTDGNGDVVFDGGQVGFITEDGSVEVYSIVAPTSDNIHPDYNGDLLDGNDFAVLELTAVPSDAVEIYGLYTQQNELFQTYTRVGFGTLGAGDTGLNDGELGFKLKGENVYESSMEFLSFISSADPDSILLSDFDNGSAAQNLFQLLFDLFDPGTFSDLGTLLESNSAPGDSGGPSFIDGMIAGVTSFGLQLATEDGPFGDLDLVLNSSFGELMGDARVSAGLPFINSFLVAEPIPVPAAAWLFGSAFAGGFLRSRRKKAKA